MKNKDKVMIWVGRVLSVLSVALFAFSAWGKFHMTPEMLQMMSDIGIPESLLMPIAALEISCVILYIIPYTSVLGAILLTGYIGGTILTHLRVGQPVYMQVTLGIAVWLGLYLRERRLWSLLPLRKMS